MAQGFEIVDDQGHTVPYQIVEDVGQETRDVALIFPADVPSLGYRAYTLRPVKDPPHFSSTARLHHNDLPRSRDWVLENQWFSISLNPYAGTFRIVDRQRHRVLIQQGTFLVRSHPITPDLSRVEKGPQEWGCCFKGIGLVETGGVRTVARVEVQSQHPGIHELVMLLILYEHAKRLDLEVMLDAFGTDLSSIHLVLATSFPHPEVTYAIPYGANRLDNLMPDSGPQDYYGFPRMDQESWRVTRLVQGWLDLSDEAGGLTIASNRRLFRIEGSALHCVLLRLTPHAQPQRSCFSLIPHDGRWDVLAPRSAEELLMPMIAYTVNDTVSRKSLPTTASFLVVEPDNVSIVAVKQGEDRSSIVVRLV